MLTDILFCCTIYLSQLILCQLQIFIGKTHRHTSNLVIVLIEYYFVFFVHWLISSLCECKYS